jgi:hypothetical protein
MKVIVRNFIKSSLLLSAALVVTGCAGVSAAGTDFSSTLKCVNWDSIGADFATVYTAVRFDVECSMQELVESGVISPEEADSLISEVSGIQANLVNPGDEQPFSFDIQEITISGTAIITNDRAKFRLIRDFTITPR